MGNISVYDKIVMKRKEEKRKYGNRSNLYINIHLKGDFGMEFTCEVMPEGALIPFTACDAYRYFAGRKLLMTSKNRSRTEYLLPTDCIIVLDSHFHFTNKSNLVGSL